jgi:hypothetical protein
MEKSLEAPLRKALIFLDDPDIIVKYKQLVQQVEKLF